MVRNYTTEFKEDAVRYAFEHPELNNHRKAKYFGIPYHTLFGWIKDYRRRLRAGNSEPVKGNLTPEEKEIVHLKQENQELQDTLRILKKAIYILGD